MPSLTELQIIRRASRDDIQLLASLEWPDLRTLSTNVMQLDSCCSLKALTQLRELGLVYADIQGVGAVAQLTGLTGLYLYQCYHAAQKQQLFSAAEQSELGSALAALSNLQNLLLSHAPPGPVTQALMQLTGLTELWLTQQDLIIEPRPLILPSCVRLTLPFSLSPQHVASIKAPQLQHLDAKLELEPSDLDTLRELCRGVLKACSRLPLHLHHAWSKEDTAALMAVLSQGWQPLVSTHTALLDSRTKSRQWSLELWHAHLSRQCLSLLPKGLAQLSCM
jgi:hypothetical protein